MDNYPPGAANDPNAPYNQTDLADTYGDDADNRIDEEMDDHSDEFTEWACDNGYLSENFTDADVVRIAKDSGIREEYHTYRFDNVVNTLAEEAADTYNYDYESYRDRYDD